MAYESKPSEFTLEVAGIDMEQYYFTEDDAVVEGGWLRGVHRVNRWFQPREKILIPDIAIEFINANFMTRITHDDLGILCDMCMDEGTTDDKFLDSLRLGRKWALITISYRNLPLEKNWMWV